MIRVLARVLAVPLTVAAVIAGQLALAPSAMPATRASGGYVPVNGAGSTWSQNALDQWRRAVAGVGILVNYAGSGSTDGRQEFIAGLTDFAVSEIPFQAHPTDGSTPEDPTRPYAYLPIVAGGTALMYHLTAGGHQIDNLRLSPLTIAKIFTGVITRWNDPLIAADNAGLRSLLPDEAITPVVRADSAGTTAQFTAWMASSTSAVWQSYCARVGLAEPCGATSEYPIIAGMRAQAGSFGVADYIAQPYGEGAIGYVETSYAKLAGFPVAEVSNTAGYFVAPSAQAVAVALLKAQINTDPASSGYLTEKLTYVYSDRDPRAYPLSSYSYLIVPTSAADGFSDAKGATLAAFGDYALCQGQAGVAALGYSPLPINLVRAGLAQLERIPGAPRQAITLSGCRNPTFSVTGDNTLARTAPYPPPCAKLGSSQCGPDAPAAGPSAGGGPTAGGSGGPAAGSGSAADGQRVPGAQAVITPGPVTVAAGGGWTATQTTMVVVYAVLLLALLGPLGVAVARRRARGRGAVD
jgi:phosphate ABC transporter phosphate-binding protein